MRRRLQTIMYHYVRSLPSNERPGIHPVTPERFTKQLDQMLARYIPATLEQALEFICGRYAPNGDLVMFTFDDALREHYEFVTPALSKYGVQGVFFVPTAALEDQIVLPVHMNQILLNTLGFADYRAAFDACLSEGDFIDSADYHDLAVAANPWDEPDIAVFKYRFSFVIPADVRDDVVRTLFRRYIGTEPDFSRRLYFDWDEARRMQDAGMIIGGHSHSHRPLTGKAKEQLDDLSRCITLMKARLRPQRLLPFAYPYGKLSSFNEHTVSALRGLGFDCAVTTEDGCSTPDMKVFHIKRTDCTRLPN
jgi:peptidoglycan/xylan/chitin deacetylase (PgdA/CDA1 family)